MTPFLLSLICATTSSTTGPLRILTLEEAVKTAQDHQPSIRAAVANERQGWAVADEARAGLLPQVTLNGTYQRTTSNFAPTPGVTVNPMAGMNAPPPSTTTFGYWNLSAQVTQLIWDFGQTLGKWDAAKATAKSNEAATNAQRLLVILNVRTAFFTARANKDLVTVARDTLTNQDRHLGQIQGFVEVGTRPDIDLAQARTDRANAEVQVITAENNYAISKAQLNQAMGVEAPVDYEVSSETFPPVPDEAQALDALVDEAIRARPEIKQIIDQIEAAQESIRSSKGGYWPSFFASGTVTDRGGNLDNLVWNFNGTLGVSWQIFQGLLTKSTVEAAEANLYGVEAQMETVRLQVRLDVEQGRLAVRATKAALVAANEALINAKERLRLAEGRYETGVGNVIELGDAQVALTTAASQLVQANQNLATARAQLEKALGRM
jgi:outer membrane protein